MKQELAPIAYRLIRSDRKTLAMEWRGGELIVRAPRFASKQRIEAFVAANRERIEAWQRKEQQHDAALSEWPPLSDEDVKELYRQAKIAIPQRAAYYAPLIGVQYGRITVRMQKTRWGSCSAAGNLNFNALLMLAPPEVLDSVVVHELCHRREMNHSKRFYAEVQRVFPAYRKWNRWLKENGPVLLKLAENARDDVSLP